MINRNNSIILKHLKEPHFELKYGYYEYDTKFSISTEYARYKLIKKLNKHFISALKIPINSNSALPLTTSINALILYGIAKNKNVNDPVFIKIDAESISINYNITEISSDIINKLNMKVDKYIERLSKISNIRTLIKQTNNNQVILQIQDRDNTKIILNMNVYKKITNRYTSRLAHLEEDPVHETFIDQLIWAALFRYKYLGILDGNQGSVNIKELLYLHKNYHVDVELFGSIINTTLKYYCSMFYDIEHYFGSIGNFFNVELISGFYEMNPPFIVWIMEDSFKHIREALENNKNNNLSVFITIPVWDINDRKLLNKFCNTNKKTDYENPKLNTLKGSKYVVLDRLYCQTGYAYTDYITFKENVNFVQSNIIVVSNKYNPGDIQLSFLSDDYIESS